MTLSTLIAIVLTGLTLAPEISGPAPDSTEVLYARMEIDALKAHCGTPVTEFERLHCRYRLYPLTWDKAYLEDLPEEPANPSAENLALLSGLWGFRASEHGFPASLRFGLRSQRLLDRAIEADPDSPFVLLVEGHALLFKPKIVGGDPAAAAERFHRLEGQLTASGDAPLLIGEAQTWRWYALAVAGDGRAEGIRKQLLARDPAPLFASMLENPP